MGTMAKASRQIENLNKMSKGPELSFHMIATVANMAHGATKYNTCGNMSLASSHMGGDPSSPL